MAKTPAAAEASSAAGMPSGLQRRQRSLNMEVDSSSSSDGSSQSGGEGSTSAALRRFTRLYFMLPVLRSRTKMRAPVPSPPSSSSSASPANWRTSSLTQRLRSRAPERTSFSAPGCPVLATADLADTVQVASWRRVASHAAS
eukprot:3351603-Prymnesium_polylepis.1